MNQPSEIRAATGPGTLRIALAQIAPALGDVPRNLALHEQQIAAALAQRANLIVFPELSLTGYFLRDMTPDVALPPAAPELARLYAAAGEAALVVGLVEQSPRHTFYNAAVLAARGQAVHTHRKVYLPNYGLFDEQHYFAAGERIEACETPELGRVGLLVCEDFWHLSAAAILQAEEIDLLICVSNSPARGVRGPGIATADTYEYVCRAYAQLLGCVVVFVNRVGFEDGLCFWGGSLVVDPGGNVVARAPRFDAALTVAEIDLAELRRERVITPLARDERLLLTLEELTRIKRRRYER